MNINLSQCFIAVDDHDKAIAFYRDVLGLEVRNDVGFEGMRWVTVGSPCPGSAGRRRWERLRRPGSPPGV
ncbi:VOC family protein, partial [Streptomyces virginiae]|uniref:VOC family protein n=1 Tax=Streptomyces virginiae TaxID=1961 RepID=UPI0033A62F4C